MVEEQLTVLWLAALDLPAPPSHEALHATFTDLGGDSISATLLLAAIQERWRVNLPIQRLFEGITLAQLAALLLTSLHAEELDAHPTALPPITRQPREHALPLSHSQRRMWLVQSFALDTTAYNVTYALDLQGQLDETALLRAINAVWARHDTFRTRFILQDGQPRQWVMPAFEPVAFRTLDLREQPDAATRQTALHTYLEQAAREPLNLIEGPLWHVHLIRLADDHHVLAWIAHHILVDLWANQILAREIAQVYSHLTHGTTPSLPDVALDCADHGHWQNTEAFDRFIQPQLNYWLPRLAELPPTNLATDHPMSPDWYRSARRITHDVSQAWITRLQQFARSQGCTPFMVLLTGLAVLMGRQGRQDDVGVLTPIANRHHPDTAGIVASLVNSLVMRMDLAQVTTGRDLLHQVKQTTLAAYAHQDLPFDILVERLGTQNRGHHDLPLGLQVMLNVANAPSEGIDFAGLTTRRMSFNRGATQLPLTFIVDLEQTHTVALEYADTLFEPDTARALVDDYVAVLDQLIAHIDQPLASLHWLSASSRHKLLQWNDTAQAFDCHQVDALLTQGMQGAAQGTACTFGAQSVSHQVLHAQAMAVAHGLAARGIGPGQRVGIHLPRGLDMLTALLGIIMSGAAYVPLDPRYPADRLQHMVHDARLDLVIAPGQAHLPFDAGEAPVASLADIRMDTQPAASTALQPAAPDDPLYIIYTSGSTGKPKGVVVPHRTVANFLLSMAAQPGLSAADTLLAVTTLSFDIAVLELLLPLSVGAHIVMASEDDVMDGHALAGLIAQHHVTAMQATPSTWRAMLDAGWEGASQLKALIGGEALRPELAQRLLPRCAALWNMYGPTETTVWSTCWRVAPDADAITIGRPIANTQIRILDRHDHDCPIGTPGEIVIEGDGVAQGYWQRPELTAERFIHTRGKATGYRTGDLGRWRHDGLIEHLGRLDHQIKVRGFRIEPGDIEQALLQHPQIAQAVVIAHERTPGDVRLVAYVVRKEGLAGDAPWSPAWRAWMREHLPEHMVPQHLMTLDRMPLLANGKLDRHALPAPVAEVSSADDAMLASVEPFTEWETRLATAWRELLGVSDIRKEDNFFDLGGHSLLAMQAIEHMARDTGVRVPPRRYIFETLGQLAASYEREASTPVTPAAKPTTDASLGHKVKRWLLGRGD